MKVIAMYLPQFHRLPENDEWWGEGFTEWTAVKASTPLFDGHIQPRKPMNNNYYNLMDKQTMLWQVDLMKNYKVSGMCFYHYWFKEGRQILEKPAENLLKWKEVDMPFCFSWANESWTRTWSRLNCKNIWTSKFEPKQENTQNASGILLEQNYGEEEMWKKHFDYLLPFFKDKRYIKINEKPVFIFYRPASIPCLERMIEYWRKLALEADLSGLYLIGTNIAIKGSLDAILLQEPQYTMIQCFDKKYTDKLNVNVAKFIEGQDVWDKILERKIDENNKIYCGGFSGYDDTPRRGRGGFVITQIAPNDFKKNIKKLMKKNEVLKNDLVFINAWNEWGEGMYLEPDEQMEYGYLEAIKEAVDTYKLEDIKIFSKKNIENELLIDRYQSYWRILNKWLTLKEEGKLLETYFEKHGYSKIAIYGVGMIGVHLVKELEKSSIVIEYGIDQQGAENVHQKFPIYKKEDALPRVDVIIVSVTYDYANIYRYLKEKVNCPIISLEEVVEESEML